SDFRLVIDDSRNKTVLPTRTAFPMKRLHRERLLHVLGCALRRATTGTSGSSSSNSISTNKPCGKPLIGTINRYQYSRRRLQFSRSSRRCSTQLWSTKADVCSNQFLDFLRREPLIGWIRLNAFGFL